MKDESKPSLGKWRNNRLYFSDHEKKLIIEDYLSRNETKLSVYKRYTGYYNSTENGKITMWMRKFGILPYALVRKGLSGMFELVLRDTLVARNTASNESPTRRVAPYD